MCILTLRGRWFEDHHLARKNGLIGAEYHVGLSPTPHLTDIVVASAVRAQTPQYRRLPRPWPFGEHG